MNNMEFLPAEEVHFGPITFSLGIEWVFFIG